MTEAHRNVVSVSWGDHLDFGEGDGRLDTPEKLARGIAAWQAEFDATAIHWRDQRHFINNRVFFRAPGTPPISWRTLPWDEYEVLIEASHARGMQVFLYVDLFDEGWPLQPPGIRAISHHNPFHGKDISSQSRFTVENPEYLLVDRSGTQRHYGVMCYAFPEVRQYKLSAYQQVLADYKFDGLFICTRSQSKPAEHADQFGFNPPIVEEYQRRYGTNILQEDFDLDAWHRLQGEYITQFLREVKAFLKTRAMKLRVGIPRGEVIGPPVGNIHLDWRRWVDEGIVDSLSIDQQARVCPSTWLRLWPMHDGYGYVQNHYTGLHMLPLEEDVRQNYGPWCAQYGADLTLARMWQPFDKTLEARLDALPGVSGLVFGSFRRDNPEAVAKDLWYMQTSS